MNETRDRAPTRRDTETDGLSGFNSRIVAEGKD